MVADNLKPWRLPPKRPYKPRAASVTSSMMSKVRAKGGKAEMAIRRELWRRGYRYRLHYSRLPGRPDLAFIRARVAVFVDGDFWHARTLIEEGEDALRATLRGKRQDWWVAKLKRNAERDREVTDQLRREGWTVVRLWESEVKADVFEAADKIAAAIDAAIR